MQAKNRKSKALKIMGLITITSIIIATVVIVDGINKAKDRELAEKIRNAKIELSLIEAKDRELAEKIRNAKIELSLIEAKLMDYKEYEYYKSKKDSISNIVAGHLTDKDKNELKENINWLKKDISWYKKAIPKKKYFNSKKRRGESLGYWEEEEDADIENIEVHHRKTIEKLLIEAQNEKKLLEKEYRNYNRKQREWNKKYDLDDLSKEINKLGDILIQITILRNDINRIERNIKTYQQELGESNLTIEKKIDAKIEELTLTITNVDFTDSSWVLVIVDDKSIEDFLLLPKISKTIKAKSNFYFILGNSGILNLNFNGNIVEFEGRRGAVRYFKLNANGLERVYNPPQLSNE